MKPTTPSTKKPCQTQLPSKPGKPTISFTPTSGKTELEYVCQLTDYDETRVEMYVEYKVEGASVSSSSKVNGRSFSLKASTIKSTVTIFKKKVQCCVKAKYIDQCGNLYTAETCSVEQEHECHVVGNKVVVIEGSEAEIPVKCNIPPRYACNLDNNEAGYISFETEAEIKKKEYYCNKKLIPQYVYGQAGNNRCGIRVNENAWSTKTNMDIPIKGTIDYRIDRTQKRKTTVNLIRWDSSGNEVCRVEVGIIEVEVREVKLSPGIKCYSQGDPHVTTFDGRKFNHPFVGEFLFWKNKNERLFPYEITVQHYQCTRSAACICAMAVKVKDAVITISRCGKKITRSGGWGWNRRVKLPPMDVNTRLHTGEKLDGVKVYEITKGFKYRIRLPHGGLVTVEAQYWKRQNVAYMDVSYYPSPLDFENSEGYCGNFNGNPNDDSIERKILLDQRQVFKFQIFSSILMRQKNTFIGKHQPKLYFLVSKNLQAIQTLALLIHGVLA